MKRKVFNIGAIVIFVLGLISGLVGYVHSSDMQKVAEVQGQVKETAKRSIENERQIAVLKNAMENLKCSVDKIESKQDDAVQLANEILREVKK